MNADTVCYFRTHWFNNTDIHDVWKYILSNKNKWLHWFHFITRKSLLDRCVRAKVENYFKCISSPPSECYLFSQFGKRSSKLFKDNYMNVARTNNTILQHFVLVPIFLVPLIFEMKFGVSVVVAANIIQTETVFFYGHMIILNHQLKHLANRDEMTLSCYLLTHIKNFITFQLFNF